MLYPTPPWEPFRFWSKVIKTESCWVWTAGQYATGYGLYSVMHWPHRAHHVAWEAVGRGTVPTGYNLHHRCGNRLCVNPDHLELMLHGDHSRMHVTTAAGKRCSRGHLYTPANTGIQKGRWRFCRICRADRQRARRAAERKRAAMP